MNKQILKDHLLSIQEDFGSKFPKIGKRCDEALKLMNVSFVRALSYSKNVFEQYTNIEKIKKFYNKLDTFINENYLRLNVQLTKERVANSNNSIAPNILPRIDKVLEASEEDMEGVIESELSNYKFVDAISNLFSVIENSQVDKYEEEKDEEDAENHIQKMILRTLKSIDENENPADSRLIKKFLKYSKSSHELSVANELAKLDESNYSEFIAKLIKEANTIVNNNEYRLKVVKLVENLENHRNNILFKSPIKVLKNVAEKNEDKLKDTITEELSNYLWVPGVKNIIQEEDSKYETRKNNSEARKEFVAKHPTAPVIFENSFFYTQLGETVYQVDKDGNYTVNNDYENTNELSSLHEMVHKFEFNGNHYVYKSAAKDLKIDVNENKLIIGNTSFKSDQIKEALTANNIFEDVYSQVKGIMENSDSFVVIDEAVELTNENNTSHIISSNSKVFKDGEIVEDIQDMIQETKMNYGVDVSKFLIEFISEEEKLDLLLNDESNKLSKVVEFFKTEIEKIDNAVDNIDEYPELFELRQKLRKQLNEAQNDAKSIGLVQEKLETEGYDSLIAEEDDEEDEESSEDLLDNKETVLNYFYQQSDKLSEDEFPEEHLDMAQKEIEEKFDKEGKISKEQIDNVIADHIQESKEK